MNLTPEQQDALARLEAAFEASGGRGVEIAEEIDRLRAIRDRTWTCIDDGTVNPWSLSNCSECGRLHSEVGEPKPRPTVEELADFIYTAIEKDFGPVGIKLFPDFSNLHDVVDANEYLIDAGNHFGLDWFHSDEDRELDNDAVDEVSARLKAGARHEIIELRHLG